MFSAAPKVYAHSVMIHLRDIFLVTIAARLVAIVTYARAIGSPWNFANIAARGRPVAYLNVIKGNKLV